MTTYFGHLSRAEMLQLPRLQTLPEQILQKITLNVLVSSMFLPSSDYTLCHAMLSCSPQHLEGISGAAFMDIGFAL